MPPAIGCGRFRLFEDLRILPHNLRSFMVTSERMIPIIGAYHATHSVDGEEVL